MSLKTKQTDGSFALYQDDTKYYIGRSGTIIYDSNDYESILTIYHAMIADELRDSKKFKLQNR
jgi:hypothetical protein